MAITDEFKSDFENRYNDLSRTLIRLMSEDSRISIFDLSKKLGVSRRTVKLKLMALEKLLGIRYTIEFNEGALGLTSPHLIHVRFTEKPDWDYVKKLLESSYIPQLAVVTKGTYDMFIYANAVKGSEYLYWDRRMQIMLSRYGVQWRPSDLAYRTFGYFPLRNELIDKLDMSDNYKNILKILNSNSRSTFSSISKNINMHFNTVAYNFNKLVNAGLIKRFTIAMDNPNSLSLMSIFSKYTLSENYEADSAEIRKVYVNSGIEKPIINRYILCTMLVGSHDFFATGVFDNAEIAKTQAVNLYKMIMKRHSPKVDYGIIEKVLIGKLPLRSVDSKKNYNVIRWDENPNDKFDTA
jgi:DNA-binding Lrp family transcriptional regulator